MAADKIELWPKKGKLKKGLIILGIVMVTALLAVLLEEKSGIKLSQKAIFPIVLACVGIWFYKPAETHNTPPTER